MASGLRSWSRVLILRLLKLPNPESARIEREKVANYLLNPSHPDNGGKAAFFFALGFTREEWEVLALAFRRLAQSTEVAKNMESPHGRKYIVEGCIETPGGKSPVVRTIWIVDLGGDAPRLISAYPRPK
jgi:hypothetical protein